MYSYNKLSWHQRELFHLLKKLGESITHSQSRNVSTLLCSWAGCRATVVPALHLWYNHAICNFEDQTFWKNSGGHTGGKRWMFYCWAVCEMWPEYWIIVISKFISMRDLLSFVWLFPTPWTVAHQAPLSMEFSRQEYWSGLLFPSPGDLSHPGIEPSSHLAGRFFIT